MDFHYDRALLGDLAGCAWRALRLWIRATLGHDTAMLGTIGFIQTAGELLNFHPHLHLLITDGVLEPDGSFERLPYLDSRQLERLFRAELLRMLLDNGLICQDVVDNLLSWRHSGFSVHAEVTVADRVSAARLGRYWGYYSTVSRGKRRAAASSPTSGCRLSAPSRSPTLHPCRTSSSTPESAGPKSDFLYPLLENDGPSTGPRRPP